MWDIAYANSSGNWGKTTGELTDLATIFPLFLKKDKLVMNPRIWLKKKKKQQQRNIQCKWKGPIFHGDYTLVICESVVE